MRPHGWSHKREITGENQELVSKETVEPKVAG